MEASIDYDNGSNSWIYFNANDILEVVRFVYLLYVKSTIDHSSKVIHPKLRNRRETCPLILCGASGLISFHLVTI